MNKLIRTLSKITILGLLLLVSSCKEELTFPEAAVNPGETIRAGFTYTISDMESSSFDPQTRVGGTDTEAWENKVSNIWVFQFDGTSSDSKLVGLPEYIDITGKDTVTLASSTEKNRIVCIANTNNDKINWEMESSVSNYSDLFQKRNILTSKDDSYGKTFQNLVMCAQQDIVIGGSGFTGVTFDFQRNLARISLDLSTTSNYTVTSVQLCNVPSSLYWADVLQVRLEDYVFNTQTSSYIHYAATTEGLPAGGTSQTINWYMPRNRQGIFNNAYDFLKNTKAPATATFFKVRFKDTQNRVFTYTLYPGENLTNNFNIDPNKSYSFKLTIDGKWSLGTDSRIEEYTQTTFAKSNCYLLNPPRTGEAARIFSIPINRVNDFWGNPLYAIYGQDPKNQIGRTDKWQCEIIWCDNLSLFDPADNYIDQADKLSLMTYKGVGPGKTLDMRLPVITDTQYGNMVVGIYKVVSDDDIRDQTTEPYLWSWQLWVTDYAPDQKIAITEEQYTYPVPGGQVERYGGTSWGYSANQKYGAANWNPIPDVDHPFAGKVMMDRPVGIRNQNDCYATPNDNRKSPAIYYQYGRKDPFWSDRYGAYDKNGNVIQAAMAAKFPASNCLSVQTDGFPTMAKIIQTPTILYISSVVDEQGMYMGDKSGSCYIGYGYIWNDLSIPIEKSSAYASKSLFDPCPSGWKIPICGTMNHLWTDINVGRTSDTDAGVGTSNLGKLGRDRGLFWKDAYIGLRYWPYIQSGAVWPINGTIYYAPFGARSGQDHSAGRGNISSYATYGYYYVGNYVNERLTSLYINNQFLLIGFQMGYKNNVASLPDAYPVRCVKE